MFYAHRIVYFLRTHENPGHMVVRHLNDGELVVGHQSDNLHDEKGRAKKSDNGYQTKRMFVYEGAEYNLKRLCEALNVTYSTVNYKLRKGVAVEKVFADLGFPGVILKSSVIQ